MPTVYPSLSIPAPRRLSMFRAEAMQKNWIRPMTWRDVRFANLKSHTGLDRGTNGKTPVWVSMDGEAFTRERFADEVENARIDHKGWLTDIDDSETARGIVARLPHGRYLAGYCLSMNDERVYFAEIFTDERDAARMADEHARVIADDEREQAEKFNQAQELETAIEKKEQRLRELLAMRHSRRIGYARDEARELIESIREARETLHRDFAGVL